jgi:hypothetical protein
MNGQRAATGAGVALVGAAAVLGVGAARPVTSAPPPPTLPPTELAAGGARYSVGLPGDVVAVGDWGCTQQPTAAVLRPSTGAVFVFDTWAATATARPLDAAPDPGAVDLTAARECGHAELVHPDGTRHLVTTTP